MPTLTPLLALFPTVVAAQAVDGPSWEPLVTHSADGRFVARIEKVAGQERVRDAMARWHLTVTAADGAGPEPFWECFFPYDGSSLHYLLSGDGTTLVHVTESFSRHRPVVRTWREGEEAWSLTGDELEVERAAVETTESGTAWLAGEEAAVRMGWRRSVDGPYLSLELLCRDGSRRNVDAGTGEPVPPARPPLVLYVQPGIPDDLRGKLEAPFVRSVQAPARVLAGAPVEVLVEGNFPTPNWRLIGFELVQHDVELGLLELVPRTAPPGGEVHAQVIDAFKGTVVLDGLDVGRWTIQVKGREEEPLPPVVVEVLPGRLRARLHTSGGVAGVDRHLSVYAPGLVEEGGHDPEAPSRFALLPRERIRALDAIFVTLPDAPPSRTSPLASDVFVYELGWWKDGRWHDVRVDDVTAEGAVRALIEALR